MMETQLETPAQQYGFSHVTLSITFSGPLLFVFPGPRRNGPVHVLAPYCPYHEAGFFYSNGSQSETDLWKNALTVDNTLMPADRNYVIDGPGIQGNLSAPVVISELNSPGPQCGLAAISPSTILRAAPERIRPDKMLFGLWVPKPEYVYPLYDDCLEVVTGYNTDPTNYLTPHCTGLRFFYRWHPGSPIYLRPPAGESPRITPPIFREFQSVSDIEVRYEGLNLNDENDPHADSRSCFASLAVLAGVEQWLNYHDGKSSPTNPSHCKPVQSGGRFLLIHSGGDCHAPVITTGLD